MASILTRKDILGYLKPTTGPMHNAMAKLYRLIFSGGTLDQLERDGVIVLILNPPMNVNKGVFERKSAGTLYARHLVYMNTSTGSLEIVTPVHWEEIMPEELKKSLDDLGL